MLRQLQFSANLFHVSTINVVENGSFINNLIYINMTPEHSKFVFYYFLMTRFGCSSRPSSGTGYKYKNGKI
jgi:hypothetical protein